MDPIYNSSRIDVEPLPLNVWQPTGNRHERRAQAARERHVLALLARIQRRQAQRAARAAGRK